MIAQIFSDLHADASSPTDIAIDDATDVVIVAGDTAQGAVKAFMTLRRIVPMHVPIVTVMGNHEHYRRDIRGELDLARAASPDFNIHLLDNSEFVLAGVRFVGATLWTDYSLFGETNRQAAMANAASVMNDHRLITWQKDPWKRFRPEEAARLHHESRHSIRQMLETKVAEKTVVVTHAAPHPKSLHDRYSSDILSAAFVSDQSDLLPLCDLWVHGHVHDSFDYHVGSTRVLCNPRGYGSENVSFNPKLAVEI